MTSIQSLQIVDYEERSEPKPHTVYKIEIRAHVRSWLIWHRYSEFDDLHSDLIRAVGDPPPAPLPPKHSLSIFRSHSDAKLLEERKAGLEQYLRAIISSKEDRWRESYPFKEFLGIPVGKQGGPSVGDPAQFTPVTWLDEHNELQGMVREMRADLNKRDALSDQGDVVASHKSNLAAKTKLASILPRTGKLTRGLQELAMKGLSEGEVQRRTDMVARLQNDCEAITRMVHVARSAGRAGRGDLSSGARNPAPEADREALLGSSAFKPIARVFGSKQKPQETEQTRPLDDHGLVGFQQTQIEQQDDQLSQLTTILQRQKQLGQAIGSEISYQNELLDDLNNDVDRVSGNLKSADKQMRRLG